MAKATLKNIKTPAKLSTLIWLNLLINIFIRIQRKGGFFKPKLSNSGHIWFENKDSQPIGYLNHKDVIRLNAHEIIK
jgi:hypothetical protein